MNGSGISSGPARPAGSIRHQPITSSGTRGRDDRPILRKPVVGVAEVPLRTADLGGHRRHGDGRRDLPVAPDGLHAVEVEPAIQLGRHIERARRRPGRLGDPRPCVAGHDRRRSERAVRPDVRDHALGPVPGHVRVVPARPGQAPSVRREARRGHEVGPAGQLHHARRVVRGRPVERDRDERVDRLPVLERVILADADQAVARRVEAHVRVAPATDRRKRCRRPVRPDAQQPSRREVGDDDQVTGREVRPSAVLVDAGPDVEPGRADVADPIRAAPSNQGLATVILGPPLQPGDRVAVPARLGEPHEPLRDQLERHR